MYFNRAVSSYNIWCCDRYVTVCFALVDRYWQQITAVLRQICPIACTTTCHSFLFCVLINFMPVIKDHKTCLRTHKLIINNKKISVLPLAQLFSVHSLWMHKDHSAVHYNSHMALRNWWLGLLGVNGNCVVSLMKNIEVTLYTYCIHCTTQQQTSYTVYLLYSLHHTTTDKLHCILTVFTAPHNRQVTLNIYCIHCTTQWQTSYTEYLLYSLHHTTTDKLHWIFTVFTAPHNNRQVTLYIYCNHCTT